MSGNYIYLFLAYVVVSDNQIDDREMNYFQEFLGKEPDLTEEHLEEIRCILTNSDEKISFEVVLNNLSGDQNRIAQESSIEMGLTLALCTDLSDGEEISEIKQAMITWNMDPDKYSSIEQKVKNLLREVVQSDFSTSNKYKWLDKRSYPKTKKLLQIIHKWSPKALQDHIEQLQEKILLNGPEYEEAIKFCKEIAEEDFRYAHPVLHEHEQMLQGLYQQLNLSLKGMNFQEDVELHIKEALLDLRDEIKEMIEVRIKDTKDLIHQKKKAMNYFTISFMGKTKAGKSTLHAVITGKGEEAIGKGKQRTTRYNRVYTWKNIRIIDTPGIGAPGGRSDEEIASSVIDQSDIICYVVKNDSIQNTEFSFLQSIKQKNKPIIILLNVKENLDLPIRLEKFLKDPEFIYTRQDAKSLDGHILRIRRYAQEYYQNDMFDIIPTQLYAALLSKQEHFSKDDRNRLYKGSHIEQFLNSIRLAIIEDGHIRRSQTILDGLLYPCLESMNMIDSHIEGFVNIQGKLVSIQEKSEEVLKNKCIQYEKRIKQTVTKEFAKLEDKISQFANNNYNKKESEIKHSWKETIESIGIEQSLEAHCKEVLIEYSKEIETYLKEMMEDLSFVNQQISLDFNVNLPSMFNTKRLVGYISALGGIASAVAFFLPAALAGPVGWVGIGIAIIGTITGMFLKSKQTKVAEAIRNLTESIEKSVSKQKEEITTKAVNNFNRNHDQIVTQIRNYQTKMITYLALIIKILTSSSKMINNHTEKLNSAYAYRLLNAYIPREQYPIPLNEDLINQTILRVDREFGSAINIVASTTLTIDELQALSKRIQEHVTMRKIDEKQESE